MRYVAQALGGALATSTRRRDQDAQTGAINGTGGERNPARPRSLAAEQITQALMQLSEAAQQTVDSLRQSGQAIDELNGVAIGLRGGVSRFTLQAA